MCLHIYIYREREKKKNISKTLCSHRRLNESLRILCTEMLRTSNIHNPFNLNLQSPNSRWISQKRNTLILTGTNLLTQTPPRKGPYPITQTAPAVCHSTCQQSVVR